MLTSVADGEDGLTEDTSLPGLAITVLPGVDRWLSFCLIYVDWPVPLAVLSPGGGAMRALT